MIYWKQKTRNFLSINLVNDRTDTLFNVKYSKMLPFSLVAEALTGLIYHRPSGENSSFVGGWAIGEVWGPLHWAPGIEWITESPRVDFKGLIGPGVATTTISLFSILHPQCVCVCVCGGGGRGGEARLRQSVGWPDKRSREMGATWLTADG